MGDPVPPPEPPPPPRFHRGPLVLAVLITTIGVGWLLTAKGFGPGINWVWTLALGVVGVITFVLSGGVDKFSVVVGPFFLFASVMSVLRQTGRLDTDTEVPLAVILIGLLLLLANMPFVRRPAWYVPLPDERR